MEQRSNYIQGVLMVIPLLLLGWQVILLPSLLVTWYGGIMLWLTLLPLIFWKHRNKIRYWALWFLLFCANIYFTIMFNLMIGLAIGITNLIKSLQR